MDKFLAEPATEYRCVMTIRFIALRVTLASIVAAATSCASHVAGSGTDGGTIDGVPAPIDAFAGPYADFPTQPILDPAGASNPAAPTNAGDLFGAAGSGAATGGPCLVEPEVGTLFPQNWLRPRFSWVPSGSENLFELRVTAGNQLNPLVVYTSATTWTMPADMWSALSADTVDQPITVTVRGAVSSTTDGATTLTSGPEVGSSGDIAVAPAAAPGSVVYWTTTGGSALRGFHIGDESVVDVLRPADADPDTQCIGCHSSTPDGLSVGYSDSPQADNGGPARSRIRSSDGLATIPTYISTTAQTLMSREQQELPVFSNEHWTDGDRILVSDFVFNGATEIMWTDLETDSSDQNTGWGIVARTGDDGRQAAYASFAHTTDTLIYVSATDVQSGVVTYDGDIKTVPYGARAGGTVTPLAGASSPDYDEFYPTFSSDDSFVAFARTPTGANFNQGQTSYNNSISEVFVIPSAGGTATRIAANDPPTCSGAISPGVTNSWPRWAPSVTQVDTRTFYWLIFSSTRGSGGNPQLYVTPVVNDGGNITTYPALYLWNQPADENNHTPAWDNFDIPIQ